jgi:hypothetical protein
MEKRLLNPEEASLYLFENWGSPFTLKPRTLSTYASLGKGPKVTRFKGGGLAYTPNNLDAYARDRIQAGSDEGGAA